MYELWSTYKTMYRVVSSKGKGVMQLKLFLEQL